MSAKRIFKEELLRLVKGIIVVAISGTAIMFGVKNIGIEKFKFIKNTVNLSVWGFIGILAFLVAWVLLYRNDIKKIPILFTRRK